MNVHRFPGVPKNVSEAERLSRDVDGAEADSSVVVVACAQAALLGLQDSI